LLAIYDPETPEARSLRVHIATDKALGDRKARRLMSPYAEAQIKLETLLDALHRPFGVGIKVQFNGGPSFRLLLDSGSSGLALAPKAAEKAGLETLDLEGVEARGVGDRKPQSALVYLASEVRVGSVAFANYPVEVFKAAKTPDYDGIAGLDVFARFLVTVDFPGRLMTLAPYSPEPGDDPQDAGNVPPQDFHRIFRFGHLLTTQTSINGQAPVLFLIDTGTTANLIDTAAARASTKVHSDTSTRVSGIQGAVEKVGRADRATLVFAGFRQENPNLIALDLEKNSDRVGTRLSGVIGMPVLWGMNMTIDYRNGAIRLHYKGGIPAR